MTERRRLTLGALAAVAVLTAGCRQERKPYEMRMLTDSYAYRVSADPQPARARERTRFKVVVLDKKTGEPIEGGQGRIFASNAGPEDPDRRTVWDGLAAGEEVGTYYSTLSFVTRGDWALALEFRRDSTQRLERVDWRQDVRGEAPAFPGDTT